MPAGAPAQAPAAAPAMPVVPFMDGTYEYNEIITTITFTPGASSVDLPLVNITPGGFLRGITLLVTSTGGVLGAGVLSPDAPWSLFNTITMESIDGTPIMFPMNGYAYYLASRYCRPWDGDPALDPGFSSTVNPSFRLRLFPEARATLGVLPNTDARAQYRLRLTANPATSANPAGGLFTTAPTTPPTVTVTVILETYAQPPQQTLGGAPVQRTPDGMGVQRFLSHQVITGLSTGDNTMQFTRTGNLIRDLLLVFRDATGVRTDLTQDPIRVRVDNTQLMVETRGHRDLSMWQFYNSMTAPGVAASVRPTGVYCWPRWQVPGDMKGQGWLETSEATYLGWEVLGAAAAGSCEVITEDLAVVSAVPPYLENI